MRCRNGRGANGNCLRRLAKQSPPLHLEQKLECLQVAARLGHRFTPSIKPMPAQQNPVRSGMFPQRIRKILDSSS